MSQVTDRMAESISAQRNEARLRQVLLNTNSTEDADYDSDFMQDVDLLPT